MKSEQLQQVQKDVQAQNPQVLRRDYLRAVRAALELLLRDIELEEKGYEFFYVVDFAAVYAYLYRTSDHYFIEIPGESKDQTFSRLQVSLHTLFTPDSRKRVLIPPYWEELDGHLRVLVTGAALAKLGVKDFFTPPDDRSPYKESLPKLVSNSEPYNEYIKLRDELKRKNIPEEKMDERLQPLAMKVAKESLPELYTTLDFARIIEVRDKLRMLFNRNILLNSDEAIPDGRQIDYFEKKTDEWCKKIVEKRKNRPMQSYTDAMACTYVETVNQILNPRKKIVVFVAPSRTIDTVLRESKMINVEDANLGLEVVRDLTYCLLWFIQKNNKDTIIEHLNKVKSLLEMYESSIPVEWREWKTRDEAARDWDRCENLLLIKDSSMTQGTGTEGLSGRDRIFLKILNQVHEYAGDSKKIEQEVEQTLSDLHQKTLELNKEVPANDAVNTLRRVKVERTGFQGIQGVRLVFPALEGELPFPISFVDRSVRLLARKVGELKENSSEENVLAVRRLALDEATRETATPENHLLAGYIMALERRYETALAELKTGLPTASNNEQLELLFVSAAIHRKLYHAQEAFELIEKGLAIKREDLRLNIECAKALWLKWRNNSERKTNIQYLDIALGHLALASQSVDSDLNRLKKTRTKSVSKYVDKVLRAQIENVSAYVHTEKALNSTAQNNDDLTHAARHLKNLEQLLSPETEWIGRFFDTRGYFQYAKAKSLPPDRKDEKWVLLRSAAQDVAHSLVMDEAADGPDLDVRREHRDEIDQSLIDLVVNRD